ncbi:hypothetical protein RB195_020832 [Necator americanus]|uniref:Sulfur globule protein CV3 domain protein n=1 Tax=Necator americanus TaxID=51031 RepID=A0ABR1CKS0_NECAM
MRLLHFLLIFAVVVITALAAPKPLQGIRTKRRSFFGFGRRWFGFPPWGFPRWGFRPWGFPPWGFGGPFCCFRRPWFYPYWWG